MSVHRKHNRQRSNHPNDPEMQKQKRNDLMKMWNEKTHHNKKLRFFSDCGQNCRKKGRFSSELSKYSTARHGESVILQAKNCTQYLHTARMTRAIDIKKNPIHTAHTIRRTPNNISCFNKLFIFNNIYLNIFERNEWHNGRKHGKQMNNKKKQQRLETSSRYIPLSVH